MEEQTSYLVKHLCMIRLLGISEKQDKLDDYETG